MKKILKLDTTNNMHKQMDLPLGKYGIVVAVVNVQSMYNADSFPVELYENLKAGKVEINSIKYYNAEKVETSVILNNINIEISAYELDKTQLTSVEGVIPVDGYKPYALVAIYDDFTLGTYKVNSISMLDVDGVIKADVSVDPVLPIPVDGCDMVDALLFRLSYIPINDYINNNYVIAYDKNSLNSIISTYVLLSNRHDISDVELIDIDDDSTDVINKTYIVVDTNGDISIDTNPFTNVLDTIKNMCRAFNIQFTATDLMIEIDSIIRGEAGYNDIKKILLEAISTDDGKAGFIENTIPLVSSGMYKTFTNFFSGELMELTIRKRIAKEILDKAQVAHSDYYTVTIIDSNVLIDEIVEAICKRELENPLEDHVYVINTSHTEYSTMNYFSFNNPDVLKLFEDNLECDFDITSNDYIDNPNIVTSNIVSITDVILSYTINSNTTYNHVLKLLKPRYCKIEESL